MTGSTMTSAIRAMVPDHAVDVNGHVDRMLLDATVPDDVLLTRLAQLALPCGARATCHHCGSTALVGWGASRRRLARSRCKTCRHTCTTATGTPFAHVHALDKLLLVALDMLGRAPASCRGLGARLGLDRMTIWRWRQLIAALWAGSPAPPPRTPRETVTVRESRKASREWTRHRQDPERHPAPDRMRWIDYRLLDHPLPDPMTAYRVRLELPDAPGSSQGGPDQAGSVSRGTSAATGEPSIVTAFQRFLAPFRGPAAKHIRTYTAWFTARET